MDIIFAFFYKPVALILGIVILFLIYRANYARKIKDKNKDNYCSGAVHTALNSIGIGLNIEDTLPSPAELSTFDYIANIYKITE